MDVRRLKSFIAEEEEPESVFDYHSGHNLLATYGLNLILVYTCTSIEGTLTGGDKLGEALQKFFPASSTSVHPCLMPASAQVVAGW